jgi:hypothetical protein
MPGANQYIAQHGIQGVYAWDTNDGVSKDVGLHCPLCTSIPVDVRHAPNGDHSFLKEDPTEQMLEGM